MAPGAGDALAEQPWPRPDLVRRLGPDDTVAPASDNVGSCHTHRVVRASLACIPGDLGGTWTFRRRLADLGTGRFGSAHGTLTVDPADRSWSEVGELRWDGRSVPVTRTLGFAIVGGEWWMTFADGRAFHPWRLGEIVEHPCAPDVYRGLVRLDRAATRLRIGWDVTGPGKQHRIVSRYVRATD